MESVLKCKPLEMLQAPDYDGAGVGMIVVDIDNQLAGPDRAPRDDERLELFFAAVFFGNDVFQYDACTSPMYSSRFRQTMWSMSLFLILCQV